MRPSITFLTSAVLLLAASTARADGMFYQLPADGTWAKYDLKMTLAMGDTKMQGDGALRMASVGRSVEKDEPCRWIEVDFQVKLSQGPDGGPQEQQYVLKVLIPEKHLKAGENPLDHMVRGWIREGDGDAVALAEPKSFDKSPLPVVLSGPLQDVKRLEPIEVESKLGKLSCRGTAGMLEADDKRKTQLAIENRHHPKSPFGVVTSQWKVEFADGAPLEAVMTMDLKLSDLGTDAKSELPEQE